MSEAVDPHLRGRARPGRAGRSRAPRGRRPAGAVRRRDTGGRVAVHAAAASSPDRPPRGDRPERARPTHYYGAIRRRRVDRRCYPSSSIPTVVSGLRPFSRASGAPRRWTRRRRFSAVRRGRTGHYRHSRSRRRSSEDHRNNVGAERLPRPRCGRDEAPLLGQVNPGPVRRGVVGAGALAVRGGARSGRGRDRGRTVEPLRRRFGRPGRYRGWPGGNERRAAEDLEAALKHGPAEPRLDPEQGGAPTERRPLMGQPVAGRSSQNSCQVLDRRSAPDSETDCVDGRVLTAGRRAGTFVTLAEFNTLRGVRASIGGPTTASPFVGMPERSGVSRSKVVASATWARSGVGRADSTRP
jgi:hypothetical protein